MTSLICFEDLVGLNVYPELGEVYLCIPLFEF